MTKTEQADTELKLYKKLINEYIKKTNDNHVLRVIYTILYMYHDRLKK